MLEEQKWGLAIFGTCFASTHFGLALGLDKQMYLYDRLVHTSKTNTLM